MSRPRIQGRRVAAILAFLLVSIPPRTVGSDEGDPVAATASEPELCREIVAASPEEPLVALRHAEERRWRDARAASRRGRKGLRATLGGGPSLAGPGVTAEIARQQELYRRAVHEARVLCECRERRGDPLREDCEAAFRELEARPGFAPPEP